MGHFESLSANTAFPLLLLLYDGIELKLIFRSGSSVWLSTKKKLLKKQYEIPDQLRFIKILLFNPVRIFLNSSPPKLIYLIKLL